MANILTVGRTGALESKYNKQSNFRLTYTANEHSGAGTSRMTFATPGKNFSIAKLKVCILSHPVTNSAQNIAK